MALHHLLTYKYLSTVLEALKHLGQLVSRVPCRRLERHFYLRVDKGAPQEALEAKSPPASAGDIRDVGLIPGSGRSPEGGMPTHSSILAWRIPMDRGAWWATAHRVRKSQT